MKTYLSSGVRVNRGFAVKSGKVLDWCYPVLNYKSIHAISDLRGTKFDCVIIEPFANESTITFGNYFASINDAEKHAKTIGAKEMYSVSSGEWVSVSLFKRILKMIF